MSILVSESQLGIPAILRNEDSAGAPVTGIRHQARTAITNRFFHANDLKRSLIGVIKL